MLKISVALLSPLNAFLKSFSLAPKSFMSSLRSPSCLKMSCCNLSADGKRSRTRSTKLARVMPLMRVMRDLAVNSFELVHILSRESCRVLALARAVPPPIMSYTARIASPSAKAPVTVVASRVEIDSAMRSSM